MAFIRFVKLRWTLPEGRCVDFHVFDCRTYVLIANAKGHLGVIGTGHVSWLCAWANSHIGLCKPTKCISHVSTYFNILWSHRNWFWLWRRAITSSLCVALSAVASSLLPESLRRIRRCRRNNWVAAKRLTISSQCMGEGGMGFWLVVSVVAIFLVAACAHCYWATGRFGT